MFPFDARRVQIVVRVRRLVCPTYGCRQTFHEQIPGVVERYQRRTPRRTPRSAQWQGNWLDAGPTVDRYRIGIRSSVEGLWRWLRGSGVSPTLLITSLPSTAA